MRGTQAAMYGLERALAILQKRETRFVRKAQLTYECPRCGAKPGVRCKSPGGAKAFHTARFAEGEREWAARWEAGLLDELILVQKSLLLNKK